MSSEDQQQRFLDDISAHGERRDDEGVEIRIPAGELRDAIRKYLVTTQYVQGSITLAGVRITGNLILSDILCNSDSNVSLLLRDCSLDSSLLLEGVMLRQFILERCRISGIRAPSLHVRDDLRLFDIAPDEDCSFADLYGSHIGGALIIEGTSHFRSCDRQSGSHNFGLDLGAVKVDGDLRIGDGQSSGQGNESSGKFTCEHGISFQNALVAGDVQISGATIGSSKQGKKFAVDATGAQVGHSVSLNSLQLKGPLLFRNIKVGTFCEMVHVTVTLVERMQSGEQPNAVDGSFATINGDLTVVDNCAFLGGGNICDANIAGSFKFFASSVIRQIRRDQVKPEYALDASGIKVGGCVAFGYGKDSVHDARHGWLKKHTFLSFEKSPPTDADYARAGKLPCPDEPAGEAGLPLVSGGVRMDGATIAGDCILDGLCLGYEYADEAESAKRVNPSDIPVMLSARALRVGGSLEAVGLLNLRPMYISLAMAHAGILGGNLSAGWGPLDDIRSGRWPATRLRLDGFQYEAVNARQRPGGDLVNAKSGKKWLKRQWSCKEDKAFVSLQPYQQLAKAFSLRGDMSAARDVLIAGFRRERKSRSGGYLGKFTRWCFDHLFGYGYDPRRTLVTLILYWLLGTMLVYIGNDQRNMFVLETSAVEAIGEFPSAQAAAEATNPTFRIMPDPASTSAVTAQGVPCGSQIDAPIYAFDVMVPLLDLRQESRCSVRPSGGFSEAKLWSIGKAVYAALGWILTSVGILTLSGVLRRDLR